jgi:hypothetical protein
VHGKETPEQEAVCFILAIWLSILFRNCLILIPIIRCLCPPRLEFRLEDSNAPSFFLHGYCLQGPSIPPVQTWARPPWAVPTQSYPGSQGVNPFAYWPQRKRDPMASFQRRNPGRNGSQIIRHRLLSQIKPP